MSGLSLYIGTDYWRSWLVIDYRGWSLTMKALIWSTADWLLVSWSNILAMCYIRVIYNNDSNNSSCSTDHYLSWYWNIHMSNHISLSTNIIMQVCRQCSPEYYEKFAWQFYPWPAVEVVTQTYDSWVKQCPIHSATSFSFQHSFQILDNPISFDFFLSLLVISF